MGYHTVTILQKNYNISCDESEILHLQECTNLVNETLGKVLQGYKTSSESTVMAMALLMIADELLDYRTKYSDDVENNNHQTSEVIPINILEKLEILDKKIHTNHKNTPMPIEA